MGFWQNVIDAIKSADVVLFVMDARMPELSGNIDLEKQLKNSNKKIIKVFNKVDLISQRKYEELKRNYKGAFLISVAHKTNIERLRIELKKIAKNLKVEKLDVGIVGYPNVGKSALTNILTRRAKAKIASMAGTTTGLMWASSNSFRILDSPGVIPFGDDEVKLGVLGARSPEKIKELEDVAVAVVQLFLENNISDLENFYRVNLKEIDNGYDILMEIGKEKKLLRKGGVIDENRTFKMVILDWQQGKLKIK